MSATKFPVALDRYRPLELDLSESALSTENRETLLKNIALIRDSIIFFTAYANTKGLGGHTGGAYDIVPETLIVDGFMRGSGGIVPILFDEAGHRVALQYVMAVVNGFMPIEKLWHYREFGQGLYGHPERSDKDGVFFSSGRLGHLWSYVNGVAEAHRGQSVVLFGSDGSQQEGGDAEAARYAVAQGLGVKLMIDDNDVTIAGHPSQYLKGFSVSKTLSGHGLAVSEGDGEDIDSLYARIRNALATPGPVAVVNKRPMAVGVAGIEGLPKGHDVIPVSMAIAYLKEKGLAEAAALLEAAPEKAKSPGMKGSTPEKAKNRDDFGRILCQLIGELPDRQEQILVVDSDLEGSCGLHHVRKQYPDIYRLGGIMERNNFSVAAGFGSEPGRQGVFGTFSAFQEMVISEITMARLNRANVLAHFSHSGVDDMADNTCHFGINTFFADNGLLEEDATRLYFPADAGQLRAVMKAVFEKKGLRFVFSTRSAVPHILKEDGTPLYGPDYRFTPDTDEVIREGAAGYVVSFGEMLYRCLDVVETLRADGLDVGLVNKPTLNAVDEAMMARVGRAPFVLVVETLNVKTGLGSRLGSWLLERGFAPRYAFMGTIREGRGGLSEQIPYQGLGQGDIREKIKALA